MLIRMLDDIYPEKAEDIDIVFDTVFWSSMIYRILCPLYSSNTAYDQLIQAGCIKVKVNSQDLSMCGTRTDELEKDLDTGYTVQLYLNVK